MLQVETAAGRSTAEFVVETSADVLLQRLESGLAGQRRFTLLERTTREVRVSARPSWAAWGARITVRVTPAGTASLVRVRWEPTVPTTVVTWGQARRDLHALEQMLQA